MTATSETLALRVHVPVACFREPYAREYWASYPLPPPSTVYGMLLSLVGEVNRLEHTSARIAIARLREAEVSRVLRTFYRWKEKEITSDKNRTPDWQELLTDVRLGVWVRDGADEPAEADAGTLRARLQGCLTDPTSVSRFGGLSLGESSHLVDGIWSLSERPPDEAKGERLDQLIAAEDGDLTLPIWPDHVGSKGSRWGRYRLQCGPAGPTMEPKSFTAILPPT